MEASNPHTGQDAPGRAEWTVGTDGTDGTDSPSPGPSPREWKPPGGQLGDIHEALETFWGGIALAFSMAGDQYCALVITERSPAVCQAWTELADKSPAVKRTLMRMVEGGMWGQVVFSTLGIAIPIMDHHGLWPLPNPFAGLTTTPLDHQPTGDMAGSWAMPGQEGSPVGGATDAPEQQRREAEARRDPGDTG